MGCGRKAWAEQEEMSYYAKRQQKLSEMDECELLEIFESLKEKVQRLCAETETASRYQFILIDSIVDTCKKLP